MTRLGTAALLVLACAAAASCDNAKKKPEAIPYPSVKSEGGEVIATVGNVVITSKDLEKRIAQQSPFTRVQLKAPERKKKYVENEIEIEILAQEGWRRGLADDPRIIAELKRAVVQRVMKDQMAEIAKKVELTENELRAGFEARSAEYNKPESLRLAQIKLAKGNTKLANEIRTKVQEAHKRRDEGMFSDLARKHSEDAATRNGGGELPFLTRAELSAKLGEDSADYWFDKAEMGETGAYETDDALYLLKKTGQRRGTQRTLEQVKAQLRSQLINEKRQKAFAEFVDELRKTLGVTINEEAIAEIEVNLDQPTETASTAAVHEDEE
jgi:parvulin-like peptidyl-prolyl isomerase